MSWADYIDVDEGREFPWQCPNRDCGEKWPEVPYGDAIACEFENCDVATCPTCFVKCYCCDRTLCHEHWMYADLGDGPFRRYCRICLEDFVENGASEQRGTEAA